MECDTYAFYYVHDFNLKNIYFIIKNENRYTYRRTVHVFYIFEWKTWDSMVYGFSRFIGIVVDFERWFELWGYALWRISKL